MRLLILFSVPLLIGNLFQQAYNMADSMIVGKLLGANSLAAVGSTGAVSFLFFSICNGLGSGGGILTAMCFGAGDGKMVKKALVNSAYIMFMMSLLTGLAGYLAAPAVLHGMGTPDAVYPEALTYMRMSCLSVPLVAVYNYASSMLRSLGDSKTPLFFLIFSCFMNIVLDLLFVGGFDMGVFGAALATMLAQFAAGIGSLAYAVRYNPYFHISKSYLAPDLAVAWRAVKLGMPLAMQWGLIAISSMALQTVANFFGAVAMAAYTATSRLEQLVMMPYSTLSTALSTYSGQNYGAGKTQRLRSGFRDSMLLMTAMAVVMTIGMQFFGRSMVGLFVNETDVVDLGEKAMRLTSWFYIFLGVIFVCRGVLNGIGDTLFSFVNGVVEAICRIALPSFFIRILMKGVMSVWLTSGVTWLLSGLSCYLRYVWWRRKQGKESNGASFQ